MYTVHQQVGCTSKQRLVRGQAFQSLSQRPVLQPHCMLQSLAPKELGQAAHVREHTDVLHQHAVKMLGHAIELQHVVHHHLLHSPCGLEMGVESLTEVLPPQSERKVLMATQCCCVSAQASNDL